MAGVWRIVLLLLWFFVLVIARRSNGGPDEQDRASSTTTARRAPRPCSGARHRHRTGHRLSSSATDTREFLAFVNQIERTYRHDARPSAAGGSTPSRTSTPRFAPSSTAGTNAPTHSSGRNAEEILKNRLHQTKGGSVLRRGLELAGGRSRPFDRHCESTDRKLRRHLARFHFCRRPRETARRRPRSGPLADMRTAR